MSVKTPRKAESAGGAKRIRNSAQKNVSGSNGKHALIAYEHLHIGVLQSSLSGEYMDANQEFCRMLGYSKKELLRLKDCTYEEDYALDLKLREQLVAGKIPFYGIEKRFMHKDGRTIWVELTCSMVRDVNGEPLFTLGVVVDISEYKKVERVLRESAENLRLATEAARMFKWELDLQKQLYTFSDNFTHVLGFSAGLLPQNTVEAVWKLSPEEDVRTISEAIASAVQNHSDLHSLQYRMINPQDGQTVWLEVNAKIVYDRQGNAQRMFGVAQNITENKRAQEEIRILSKLPEENPNPVMRLTTDGTVLYANHPGQALLQVWEQQIHQPVPDQVKKQVAEAFASGVKKEIEVSQNGKTFSCTLAPVREAGYVNLYGNDITLRKQAEQALAEYARQQAALYQLSDRLHHTSYPEDVYNAALEAILSALHCDRASILLFDDAGIMRFAAWRGLSDEYRRATEGHSPWSPDEKNPYPICVSDIPASNLSDSLKATIQKEGIGSLVFTPLISNGKLIGKFMVYFNAPHECSDVEIELGLMIARQLASGIERKRAESQLRESEERYRTIVDTANEGIWYIDTDAATIYLNEPMANILGYSAEEIVGRKVPEFCFEEDMPKAQARIESNYQGNNENFDFRFRRKDGSEVLVLASTSPVRDTADRIIGALGMFVDVTERKQAEKRLALLGEVSELTRRLEDPRELMYAVSKTVGEYLQAKRCLFNEIDLAADREVVYRDFHNGVPSVAGVHKLSEYSSLTSAEMQAGKTVVNFDSKTDPRTAQDYERTYESTQERAYVAIPLMRKNRWVASFWVSDSLPREWRQEDVSLLETVAERTWTAIEKLRINETLRASESLYRTIARSIPGGGVYVVDRDFRYLVAEGPVTEMFGLSRQMLEGHTVSEVFPDDRGSRMEERLQRNFAGETISFETTHEGRVYWTQQAPLLDSIGQAIILTVDITERKQAEEALRIENERFMRFVNSNIVGILIGDADGRVILANDYYLRLLGVSRQDFIDGKVDWKQFTPPEWLPVDEKAIQQLRTQGVCEPYEKEYVRTDGVRVPVYIADAMLPGDEIAAFVLDITERKRAEEALRQSEERFVRFMQHLPGLAWIKDIQGRYVYVNAAAEKAFDTSREEMYGRTDIDIFPPEPAVQFKRNDEQVLIDEKSLQTVETLPQKDGILHYSLVTKFPIPGPDGSMALIGGTAFDITERLQAEEALRESEERFRALLRQATAGIVRKDSEGRFTFVNEAFCGMLGYTEAELFGKTVWEFMHEEDIAENRRSFHRLMMQGVPFKLERRFLRKDGSLIWVDASVSPVMDAEGKPQSAVAVEVDITGRKQAEEELQQLNLQLESRVQKRTTTIQAINQSLREEIAERQRMEAALRVSEAAARESEEKLRTLFDLLPVGISFLDPEGRILQMNSALPNILRLTREQLADQTYRSRKYIHIDGTPMSPDEFASARALKENRTIYNVETGILLETGEVIWTSVSAAPVNVADVGVVVVTIDTTESKRAERALQESHARLRFLSQRLVEVQEEERRALARELHDRVGQTLAALNINLIIMNSQLSAEAAQLIGARLNDSMKLVGETIALVRDVMTDLRPAVLDDYGLEAALDAHLRGFKSRYTLQVAFEKSDHPIPRLGPSLEMTFLRIAQEALMNIAKHAHAEHVSLSLREADESICLTVQDDGIGIDSWQEANRPGSHGLTIMRERAEAFGGTLQVKSVPGQGTRVETCIPFRKNKGQDKAQEERLS